MKDYVLKATTIEKVKPIEISFQALNLIFQIIASPAV